MTRSILVQIPANEVSQFLDKTSRAQLESFGRIIWNPHNRPLTQEELIQYIPEAHTVVTTWRSAPVTDEVLKHARQLKLIAHMAGAVKPYMTPNIYDRGIRVLNSGYAIAVSVGESVLAIMLALGHNIVQVDRRMRNGEAWKDASLETFELRGKTVGLVGLGMVAREVIKVLRPFQPRLLGCDPYFPADRAAELGVELLPLDDLLSGSDIVSLHAPKIPETYRMIGRRELALLRDGAMLINTARGGLIDEEALLEQLRTGRVMAGLDVFEKEPLALDSEFRRLPNVLARPHLAGVTRDSKLRIGSLLVEEMRSFYEGGALRFEVMRQQLELMT